MNKHSWIVKWPVLGLGAIIAVAAIGIFMTTQIGATGPGSEVVHSCVNSNSGEIKIIGDDQACKKNEDSVDWNIEGPQGDTGPPGPQGEIGPDGPQGDTGPGGPPGETGDTGPDGNPGEIGSAGPQGETGDTGQQGPQGNAADRVAVKNVNGDLSTYLISTGRYHVEATKAVVKTTVPLDMTIVNRFCMDEDGCSISVGMRNWASSTQAGNVASTGPFKLFMSESSNWWRAFNDVLSANQIYFQSHHADEDGNGVARHMLRAHDCYFTDGEYAITGVDEDGEDIVTATDNSVGFGLLNWFQTYVDPNMVCVLDIED